MGNAREEIRRIMITTTVLDRIYEVAAKRLGVKESTIELFYALDDGKPHSQTEICREWLVPKTTINTLVKECVRDGYIALVSEAGSKEKKITITEAGREHARHLLDVVYGIEERAYARTLEEFSPEFIRAMTRFTDNVNEEFEEYFRKTEQEKMPRLKSKG